MFQVELREHIPFEFVHAADEDTNSPVRSLEQEAIISTLDYAFICCVPESSK